MKIYCFDIDGTLCTNTDGNYDHAEPYLNIINHINHIYDAGNYIILFTARGSTTGINWHEKTEQQLKIWNVKYHKLLFGKPYADLYIDDKAININDYLKWGIK